MAGKIRIENLSFCFSRHDPVFSHVSFTLDPGEVFCLLGPNGSGKSTLLKCIAQLLVSPTGKVVLDDENLGQLPAGKIARRLGFVPQSLVAAFPFSVADIVVMGRASRIGMTASPSTTDRHHASAAMEKLGIAHLAKRPCNRLSGGEWQMVLIARALTQSPRVLLLDEPTSHLDLGNQIKILEVVDSLSNEGMTIIMASHFPDHAFLSAHKVGILKNKALTGVGAPDRVLTQALLEDTYETPIRVLRAGNEVDRKICVPLLNNALTQGAPKQDEETKWKKLTHWHTLWEQLSEIQSQAFEREKQDQAHGQKEGQPENKSEDFWKHKARQFDKMVEERWSKPDSSRDFLVHKLQSTPGSTLLDIGAGTGKWSLFAAPYAAKVTALEPSPSMQQVLREKIAAENITNIDIVTGTWPNDPMAPHDYVLASHSMYGVKAFEQFVNKMAATATRGCLMVLRAPFADAIMAKAATRVFGQPYDSPNFQIAYNILLAMDIYPDVIMEADGSWPGWDNDNFEDALAELKNRLALGENTEHDSYLMALLKENLTQQQDRVIWPAGNRSALVYWEV